MGNYSGSPILSTTSDRSSTSSHQDVFKERAPNDDSVAQYPDITTLNMLAAQTPDWSSQFLSHERLIDIQTESWNLQDNVQSPFLDQYSDSDQTSMNGFIRFGQGLLPNMLSPKPTIPDSPRESRFGFQLSNFQADMSITPHRLGFATVQRSGQSRASQTLRGYSSLQGYPRNERPSR